MREIREALDMSQRELSEQVEPMGGPAHQPAIARIEAGTREVKLNEAFAIAAGLGVELDYLCSETATRPVSWTEHLTGERMPTTVERRQDARRQIKELRESIAVSKSFIEEVNDEEPLTADDERLYIARMEGRLEALAEMEQVA
jgi:transcriptional regulator with XRE-family HTH domain